MQAHHVKLTCVDRAFASLICGIVFAADWSCQLLWLYNQFPGYANASSCTTYCMLITDWSANIQWAVLSVLVAQYNLAPFNKIATDCATSWQTAEHNRRQKMCVFDKAIKNANNPLIMKRHSCQTFNYTLIGSNRLTRDEWNSMNSFQSHEKMQCCRTLLN